MNASFSFSTPTKSQLPFSLSYQSPKSLGYLAFPPESSKTSPSNGIPLSLPAPAMEPDKAEIDAHFRAQSEARERRLQNERAEALQGEMEFVRMGGSLRDPITGRRDPVRTKALRDQVRILDRETLLTKRWTAHETNWTSLLASNSSITFTSIPWPLDPVPSSLVELQARSTAIPGFLLEPLSVRGTKITKRDRIRASLLRWHPDKISALLTRIVSEQEKQEVREAFAIVFVAIRALQDAEK